MLPQNLDLEFLTCGEECLSIQTLPVHRRVKDAYGCCKVSGRSSSLRCNSLEAEGMVAARLSTRGGLAKPLHKTERILTVASRLTGIESRAFKPWSLSFSHEDRNVFKLDIFMVFHLHEDLQLPPVSLFLHDHVGNHGRHIQGSREY